MKKMLVLIAVLAMALWAGAASAQNPLTMELDDCDFTEYGGTITAGADTLWFCNLPSTYNTTAGIGLADHFKPRVVPVGSLHDIIKTEFRVPRKVFLFAKAPFEVQPWYYGTGLSHRGGNASNTAYVTGKQYVYVDSLAIGTPGGPTSTIGGQKYPCQIQFSFLDSLHIKVGVADSVKILVGY